MFTNNILLEHEIFYQTVSNEGYIVYFRPVRLNIVYFQSSVFLLDHWTSYIWHKMNYHLTELSIKIWIKIWR